MPKMVEKISDQGCVGFSMKDIQALLMPTIIPIELSAKRAQNKRNSNGGIDRPSIEFEIATSLGLMDEYFTNHECIPSLESAYYKFTQVYPSYKTTKSIDEIREKEYSHLLSNNHVCMDYFGFGLFSHLQYHHDVSSSSSLFSLSYLSANLPSYALYGAVEPGTLEFQIRSRVMQFLRIQERDYSLVLTASRSSAFGLLAESYPFHFNKKLLSVYDYENEGMNWMVKTANKRGAKTMSARFEWPSLRVCSEELKKALMKKKKKKSEESSAEGLFIFPGQSRVTGAKYSHQWISYAQRNGWHVVLDASALGPKDMDSLGLSMFLPEYIICSFYKVYAEDPTGFGCLLIKKSAISCLHTSSAARGIGMVKIVPLGSNGCSSVNSNYGIQDGLCSETPDGHVGRLRDPQWGLKNKQLLNLRSFSGPISAPFGGDHAHKSVINISDSIRTEQKSDTESFTEVDFGSEPKRFCYYDASSSSDNLTNPCDADVISLRFGSCESKGKHEISSLKEETVEEIDEVEENEEKITFQDPSFMHNSGLERKEESIHLGYLRETVGIKREPFTPEESKDCPWDNKRDMGKPYLGDKPNWIENERVNVIMRSESQLLFKGLDHADSLGLNKTSIRLRYLINWLVNALTRLCHPPVENSHHLVRIYGPKVKYIRGASVAFNIYDWKGELVEPMLVQKLADRSNVSLSYGVLHNIWFPEKYADRVIEMEAKNGDEASTNEHSKNQGRTSVIPVVTAALSLVSNFEDVYRLWAFVAKFLDADFLDKERWRYRGLNQKTVEIQSEASANIFPH